MFKRVLEELHRTVEGSVAISLIGADGIAIDSVRNDNFPLESLAGELSSFLRTLRTARTDLDTGDLEQFVVTTEKYITFLSKVAPDYFILMVLSRDGNYGRARFELRRAKQKLQPELS